MIRNKKMSIKKINKDILEKFSLDNIRDFTNKYLLQILYLIIAILVVSLLTIFFTNRANNLKQKDIIGFYQAINYISEGKNEEALSILNNIYTSSKNSEIKTLSGIKVANILLEEKKYDEAVKIYLEIYNLDNNNEFLKNLSGVAGLNILISQNNKSNYDQIEKLLKELNNPKNPLLPLVQEQNGIFELQKGNTENGLEILNSLLKQDIDQDMIDRINSIIKAVENENI